MQALVTEIMTEAASAGVFLEVSNTLPMETVSYPALYVWRPRSEGVPNESRRLYRKPWRFTVYILSLKPAESLSGIVRSVDYSAAEALTTALFTRLASKGWRLSSEDYSESMATEKDILLTTLTLQKEENTAY